MKGCKGERGGRGGMKGNVRVMGVGRGRGEGEGDVRVRRVGRGRMVDVRVRGGHRGKDVRVRGVGRWWEKGGDVRVGGDGRRAGCKVDGRRKKGGVGGYAERSGGVCVREVGSSSWLAGFGGNEDRVATCTFADFVEVPLQVVAVQFGSTEDEGAVHVVLLDGSHHVLSFQYLHRLRVRLCKHMYTNNWVQ